MRRRGFAGALAVGAVGAGSVIVGCMLFTGSTDGYARVDAGQDATTATPCASASDGGLCVVLKCNAAAACNQAGSGGDAASQVCCLGFASTTTFGFTCQSSCGFETVQACATNGECGDASCISQACVASGTEYDLQVCGLLPGCAVLVPASADAGAPDSGPQDGGGAIDADASGFDAAG